MSRHRMSRPIVANLNPRRRATLSRSDVRYAQGASLGGQIQRVCDSLPTDAFFDIRIGFSRRRFSL